MTPEQLKAAKEYRNKHLTKKEKFVNWLFSVVYYTYFHKWKSWNGKPYMKVIRVINWNTALVETYDGQRKRMIF